MTLLVPDSDVDKKCTLTWTKCWLGLLLYETIMVKMMHGHSHPMPWHAPPTVTGVAPSRHAGRHRTRF